MSKEPSFIGGAGQAEVSPHVGPAGLGLRLPQTLAGWASVCLGIEMWPEEEVPRAPEAVAGKSKTYSPWPGGHGVGRQQIAAQRPPIWCPRGQ